MAAHPEIAHIVEKDHPEIAIGAVRRDEQRADPRIGAARLVHDRGAIAIEALAKALHPFAERTLTEIRTAREHEARGLAAGMRIDDLDLRTHGRESRARSTIAITAARRSPASGRRGGRTRSEPRPMICSASLMDCTRSCSESRCSSGMNQR